MATTRGHLTAEDLHGIVNAAFDGRHQLRSVERLRGGTKKGVYRLAFEDGGTCIGYIWNDEENYWPAPVEDDSSSPFFPASGLDLFEAAHTSLSEIGVRVPRLFLVDRSKALVAGEVAVLEDLAGGTLEALIEHDPVRAEPVLVQLGELIQAMHGCRREQYGRPGRGYVRSPIERIVLERAGRDLAESAARVDRIAAVEHHLADALRERFAAVTPRAQYSLIHGELGPDHVAVDDLDRPVLIDIEGIMFFDVEWEHVFLELRFGEHYRHLEVEGLDTDRLRFYRLAQYLSLVAGPLRLLEGDFPDRAFMLDIVADNIRRTLGQL